MNSEFPRRTLWLLYLCCFCSMASMRICDSLLPSFVKSFSVTTGLAAQTISSFALAYGLSQIVVGPLGDRFGKVRIIAVATLGCAFVNIFASVATSMHSLLISRTLSGVAAAAIVPLSMAWIGDNVAYEKRHAVLSELLGATVFGMIAGQWAGGILSQAMGWRNTFLLLAGLFVSGGILAFISAVKLRVDAPKSRNPLPRVASILGSTWARIILLITFFEGFFAFSSLAFIPTYLHDAFSLTMPKAGAVVALYGVGGFVFSKSAKAILQRLNERNLARSGGLLLFLSFGTLGFSPAWQSSLPACALAGFGFYMLHSLLQTYATQMAPMARGTALSLFSGVLFLGQALGILIAGWLINLSSARLVFINSALGLLILAFILGQLTARSKTAAGADARSGFRT